MNTPMAIEARVARGTSREEVIASRDRRVPSGTGWAPAGTSAYAALFLHSDEAAFITLTADLDDAIYLWFLSFRGLACDTIRLCA
jgi:hypothetical protein